MRILLILATIADIGIGILFIAVSGFVLQGVNNTGPGDMPTAVFFVGYIVLCFAAPLVAWLWKDLKDEWKQVIAWSPVAIGAIAMVAGG